MSKSYRDLEIYQFSHKLAVEIHKMTMTDLPPSERFEEAIQIRRASKSISTNIFEGFGRRKYIADYLRFLTYSHASCDETMEQLFYLRDTNCLSEVKSAYFIEKYETLGKDLFIHPISSKVPQQMIGNQRGLVADIRSHLVT
jgi:four helix bundle protein